MTIKEFAKSISGRELQKDLFTEDEIKTAEQNGFVICCGMRLCGAVQDTGDCRRKGVDITAKLHSENTKDENGKPIPWTYETDIPHETFVIYNDGEPYCRGIVFSVDDVR